MNKRILMSSLLAVAGMSCLMFGMDEAFAQSSAEELEPIVYFLVDTSRSMNEIMTTSGVDNNNTRLTKALGEIAGASNNMYTQGGIHKLKRDFGIYEGAFTLPYSIWRNNGYESVLKTVGPKSDAAFPNTSSSNPDDPAYANSYADDGIIQTYRDKVKFGFAGFAVGTEGSDDVKSEFEDALDDLGAQTGKYLRFTLRWGYESQSDSDVDLHAYVYRGSTLIDHIYYGDTCSKHGCSYGYLDLDNIHPKTDSRSHTEGSLKVPYENIYWDNNTYFQDGDVVELRVHNYTIRSGDRMFQTEVAYFDDYGCKTFSKYEFKGSMSTGGTYTVAKVKYDGTRKQFLLDTGYTNSSMTVITTEAANRPDNIYGLSTYSSGGVTYGKVITDSYKSGRNCEFNMGIWESVGPWNMNNTNPEGKKVLNTVPAPLNYPTAYNTQERILASNNAIVKNVRSYTATAATPIGESLADLYYLFGAETAPNFKASADEGVWRQPNGTATPQEDLYYNCRQKAVVLITDGGPNGSGYDDSNLADDSNEKGHADKVWYDAKHLFEQGIKVFPVGYAEFQLTAAEMAINLNDTSATNKANPAYKTKKEKLVAIDTLNRTAWQGGTCRHPTTYELIQPTNVASFNSFNDNVYNDSIPLDSKVCFYNAADSLALRAALVSALSEMLQGDFSKTKVVNSNVVGANSNYDTVRGSTNHGYYSVYSGYSTSLAPIRKAKLQRETTVCNHSTGKFHNDEEQFLDLAHRLKCRLTTCDMWRAATKEDQEKHPEYAIGMNYKFTTDAHDKKYTKRAGYGDTAPTPCAKPNYYYNMSSSSDNLNTCMTERYIFSAKYNVSGGDNGDRYAISTFPRTGNVGILDSGLLSAVGISNSEFGIIPNSNGVNAFHFATNDNVSSCKKSVASSEYNRDLLTQYSDVNYLVSPFECFDDMDCGISGETHALRHCDLGRCIDSASITNCKDNTNIPAGKICINNEVRTPARVCDQHSDCSDGQVCHAGLCVYGVVKDCDIRQFIATQPLGIIEYATPVTVTPPSRPYRSSDYIRFASKYKQRDIMLMVGANDGMLHSFILGDNDVTGAGEEHSAKNYRGAGFDSSIYNIHSMPDYYADVTTGKKEGDELWAFIPKLMLPKLSSLASHDHNVSFINGTPTVSDVKLPGFTLNGDAWRTVLVGGFRNGGRGYYALDITDPGHPIVLWEIDNQWQLGSPSTHSIMGTMDGPVTAINPNYPFNMMGYSYAQPIITKMVINNVPEPVVILSGGMPESLTSAADRTGRVMYIVKLFPQNKDDLIVKTFYFDNPVTGAPAVFPNNFDSTAQLIYVGDSKGNLYRLDVSSSNKDTWGSVEKTSENYEVPVFNPASEKGFGDGSAIYSPITFPPAVSLYEKIGNQPVIQVAFGTGSNDSFYVDQSENHYFASFIDVPVTVGGVTKYELNYDYGSAFRPSVTILNAAPGLSVNDRAPSSDKNYRIYFSTDPTGHTFEKGQKLTGAPITYNYATYFPTFMVSSGSDQYCPVGGAAIWKVESEDVGNAKKITRTLEDSTIQKNGDIENPFYDGSGSSRSYYQLNEGTKIFGLEVTNMQYCANSVYGATSLAVPPQLIAQTSSDSKDNHSKTSEARSSDLKGSVSSDIPAIAVELEAIAPVMTPSIWTSVYE